MIMQYGKPRHIIRTVIFGHRRSRGYAHFAYDIWNWALLTALGPGRKASFRDEFSMAWKPTRVYIVGDLGL